jgi:hypothetical protein
MTDTTKSAGDVNPREDEAKRSRNNQYHGPRREEELAEAAREVLDRWETGDLAGAVRRLDAALSAYRNRKPGRA